MKGGAGKPLVVPELDALAAQPKRDAAWSREEDDLIARYYGVGMVTPKALAAILTREFKVHRTSESVTQRACKLRSRGIPVRCKRREE